MRVTFCGVRGSSAAPGRAFSEVGGHTSCVAISLGGDGPSIVLDAGTGIRRASALLGGRPFRGAILLTHLHWDHLCGLPFFAAADRRDATTQVYVPRDPGADDARSLVEQVMRPPFFPITPDGLLGDWAFDYVGSGWQEVEGAKVLATDVPHGGGVTVAYRVEHEDRSIVYAPDHRADLAAGELVELARGADLLVHDAQFLADEASTARAYGHSTVNQAVELAVEAEVGHLSLFHHSPDRSDDDLRSIVLDEARSALGRCRAVDSMTLDLAVEGSSIDL